MKEEFNRLSRELHLLLGNIDDMCEEGAVFDMHAAGRLPDDHIHRIRVLLHALHMCVGAGKLTFGELDRAGINEAVQHGYLAIGDLCQFFFADQPGVTRNDSAGRDSERAGQRESDRAVDRGDERKATGGERSD